MHEEQEEDEVSDVEGDAPVQAKAETSEPSNFLAMYFREMAELDVLRPEEEFRQAKDIETLEIGKSDNGRVNMTVQCRGEGPLPFTAA